jgi:hypothetical protein
VLDAITVVILLRQSHRGTSIQVSQTNNSVLLS